MALSGVPPHLRIRILHSDEDVVVLDKPCDLRSVPGHKYPPPPQKRRRRSPDASNGGTGPRSHRRTAQEAWVASIKLLGEGRGIAEEDGRDRSTESCASTELVIRLGATAKPDCVPRKLEAFVRYCHRNAHRLLPDLAEETRDRSKEGRPEHAQKKQHSNGPNEVPTRVRGVAHEAYAKIQRQQRSLLKAPAPTEDGESALGQLHLMGFGENGQRVDGTDAQHVLHVVHRLDCQTSGIMVVARNPAAAAFLCKAWKEREAVRKVYLAQVRRWPPYHEHQRREGTIDLPLAPSPTERVKWEVRRKEGGKECRTYWKVHEDLDEACASDQEGASPRKGITLELHPITGRTHQLRLHCAAIGSGIVGDSLYGDAPEAWREDRGSTERKEGGHADADSAPDESASGVLRLHAHKLAFPHVRDGRECAFESPTPWQ